MGGVTRVITGKPSSSEKPDKENYGNPWAADIMARLLASIDEYKSRTTPNWRDFVPPEQRPYEWRSDEERKGIRDREATDADQEDRPKRPFGINEADADDSAEMVTQPQEEQTEQTQKKEYSDAAFAAAYDAARRGMSPQAFKAVAPKAFGTMPKEKQNEEIARLRDYIARGKYGGL